MRGWKARQPRFGPHFICYMCDFVVTKIPCWGCGEACYIDRCSGPTAGLHNGTYGCAACDGEEYCKPPEEEK